MQYGKLIDGDLQFAPKRIKANLEIDGQLVPYNVTNPPGDLLAAHGYLPVTFTDQPDDAPEGYYYEPGWAEEGGSIVRTWTLVEDPNADEISAEEALEILTGGAADEED